MNIQTLSPVSQPDFIRDKTAVFLLRDPRDISAQSTIIIL